MDRKDEKEASFKEYEQKELFWMIPKFTPAKFLQICSIYNSKKFTTKVYFTPHKFNEIYKRGS